MCASPFHGRGYDRSFPLVSSYPGTTHCPFVAPFAMAERIVLDDDDDDDDDGDDSLLSSSLRPPAGARGIATVCSVSLHDANELFVLAGSNKREETFLRL